MCISIEAERKAREEAKAGRTPGQPLKPVSETLAPTATVVRPQPKPAEAPKEEAKEHTAESVFARLNNPSEKPSED